MTATLERAAQPAGSKRPKASIGLPAVFQVNLLPPEVRSARTLTYVKRWLAGIVLFFVLLAVGLVALAVMAERAAQSELAAQQKDTADLLAEQEQYAEVPLVLGQLDQIVTAREMGMSTEILWKPYMAAVAATAPSGVEIETLNFAGATPLLLPAVPTDVLTAQSVGTISFTAKSLTLPDTAAWIDGLASVPGFADPWFSAVTLTEEEQVSYYTVNATVQVNGEAYANRFKTTDEAED